jgi:hypothetical protein
MTKLLKKPVGFVSFSLHSNPQRTEERTLRAFARCGLPDSLFEQLESLEKLRQAEL